MGPIARYLLLEVGLAAVFPIAVAAVVHWIARNELAVFRYIGDGQLCFYVTTLGVVTIPDLLGANAGAELLTWGIIVITVFGLFAMVVWVTAINMALEHGLRDAVRQRIARFSLAVAGATVLVVGILRSYAGLM